MSGDVFKELEELRRLLDAPLPQCSSNGKDHEIHQKLADQPLHSQDGVARLSKAINQADEEMDAVYEKAEHAHKMSSIRKEREVQVLRQIIAEKEKNCDDLRETLSSAQRALEGKVRCQSSQMAQQDKKGAGLTKKSGDSLHTCHDTTNSCWETQKGGIEDENLVDTQITQLQAQVTDLEQSRAMLARQNEDLQQQVQTATSQHVKQCEELQAILVEAQIAIQHLRADKVELTQQCKEHKDAAFTAEKRASSLSVELSSLQSAQVEQKGQLESMAASMQALQRKLNAERKVRKASEKWLRAEMKSREDMESLFTAVRSMTLSENVVDGDAEFIQQLVDSFRMPQASRDGYKRLQQNLDSLAAECNTSSHERTPRKDRESDVLHRGLSSAKELLHQRLKRGKKKGGDLF